MANSDLNVELREATGKGASRSLRREEKIPAVVYGKGIEPCSITLSPKELKKAISTDAGLNTLITLKGNGVFADKVVIVKDMDVHPLRRVVRHADFQIVDMTKQVQVMVPVHAVGKSEGEKAGGNLNVIRKELEIICLPTAIPTSIDINVDALNIGDVIHIDDVTLPEGVEAPHDVNFTVITCVGRMIEKEETDEEGEEEVEESEEE